MPTVYFSPVGNGQLETSAGVPATGSVVKTYVAGTTTPLATYSDSGGTTPNSTTLTVNSLGHVTSSGVAVQVWISQATKFVWETAGGAVLRTWDNVPGINTITPAEWVASGLTPTYVSATQFTVPGDQTSVFTVPRSLRITQTAGTTYGGYVSASSHSSGTTTVTVTGATVDSGISAVDYGFANPAYPSLLRHTVGGECYLSKSGSNLLLSPHNGNLLAINGALYQIPSAGVTLSASGLTLDTTYYIYAYMSGATMTLEASTTARATDTTTGVQIKTGDATRSLVGMARCITGPAWSTLDTGVLSWFNRRERVGEATFSANRSTTSTTPVEFNSEIRVSFLCWSDDRPRMHAQGGYSFSAGTGPAFGFIGVDGTTQTDSGGPSNLSGAQQMWSAHHQPSVSEGWHYSTVCGMAPSTATATMIGGANAGGQRVVNRVTVRG